MTRIKLISWIEDMKKISFTKLQTELCDLSLKQSKENVDSLLDNKPVELIAKSEDIALEFIKRAQKLGVICGIIR